MQTFMKILDWILLNWERLVGIVVFLITLISGIVASIKNKNWVKLKESLAEYVKDAELLNADGAVKMEVVLAKAQTLCVALHIRYNEAKVRTIIESIVLLSKTVNARDKDKVIK